MSVRTVSLQRRDLLGLAGALAWPLGSRAEAGPPALELLHWWTSGSEAAMLAELRRSALAAGLPWKDTPVAGAGHANTVLKTRFLSGHPPALAQIDKSVRLWGEAVPLADLSPVSADWPRLLPAAIDRELRWQGRPVAVPLNVHRLNSMWSNRRLLQRLGLAAPRSWDEFFQVAEALQRAGVIPLAIGSSVGQKLSVFVNLVLGRGGPAFFERALVQGDASLLGGRAMLDMLREFKRIKRYTDAAQVSRDWAGATGLLLQGRAALQFTGDWANGEFQKAGWQPGEDYDCHAAPGHADLHYFEFDRLLFFKPQSPEHALLQQRLATVLMQAEDSARYARIKGGIPVRRDASLAGFNACARQSHADFRAAEASGRLVLALGARLPEAGYGALRDVVAACWASERLTPELAQKRLLQAAKVRD
ncbi:ABC transporter substrate-binding protein [Kinneretia aquatilis]|uniref:ABC transporter substrate-binding protein n=1 Tax=Kinneretia aquatilis TaxID=2070761 RepID=UPI0014950A0A|nr:ABC transporter substrate-binding protein [Paucibacter aquatile]WIV98009.1 ABC transporter substrate-binding protein [Paucibacter aquatile]